MDNHVEVHPLTAKDDLEKVYRLVHDTFVAQKMARNHPSGQLAQYPRYDLQEDSVILLAYFKGVLAGTISFTPHQNSKEFYNGELFQPEIKELYQAGDLAFSCWRLATQGSQRHQLILSLRLIQRCHEIAWRKGLTDCYFSFIKPHLNFYQKIFPNSTILGPKRKTSNGIQAELYFMKYVVEEACYQKIRSLADYLERQVDNRAS
ncbi:MAG: hypothetical protein AAFR61_32525 [Bacteroidota bacterium]